LTEGAQTAQDLLGDAAAERTSDGGATLRRTGAAADLATQERNNKALDVGLHTHGARSCKKNKHLEDSASETQLDSQLGAELKLGEQPTKGKHTEVLICSSRNTGDQHLITRRETDEKTARTGGSGYQNRWKHQNTPKSSQKLHRPNST
jgi:hypothetical protein